MLSFKCPSGVVLTDLNDIFDPRKNDLLLMNMETDQDYRRFMQELWKGNGESILEYLASTSVHVKKWVNTFSTAIPREEWYILGLFEEIFFYGTEINYSTGTGSELRSHTDRKYASLSEVFLTEFNRRKAETYTGSRRSVSWLPGYFGSLREYSMNKMSVYKGSTRILKRDILDMIRQGLEFKFDVQSSFGENNVILISHVKVQMMINYANRSELYRMFEYSTDIISTVQWQRPDYVPDTLYGIELEHSTDYSVQALIDAFPEIYAFVKKDSTVNGSKRNAGELVTIPADIRKHRKMFASFFKNLNEDMFDTLDKHNNGMHIHIDRLAFETVPMHLKKFCWFFTNPANHKFLEEISERNKASIDSYARFVTAPRVSRPMPGKSSGLSMINGDRELRSSGKHTFVNLGKAHTVEVRLFKGVVAFASIMKNLEFVDSILEFSKYGSYSDMNIVQYIKFLRSQNVSKYRALNLAVSEMDLDGMMILSEINSILKGSSSASEIVSELNKKTFEAKYIKKIIKEFNDIFESKGKELKFENRVFILNSIGTRFAKFNDQLLRQYNR
jgi:hypothetical protein